MFIRSSRLMAARSGFCVNFNWGCCAAALLHTPKSVNQHPMSFIFLFIDVHAKDPQSCPAHHPHCVTRGLPEPGRSSWTGICSPGNECRMPSKQECQLNLNCLVYNLLKDKEELIKEAA